MPLLSPDARPYVGELLDRRTFIAARYSLKLTPTFVTSSLGIPYADLGRFERKEICLSFEVLGRYAALIRHLSSLLERGERQLSGKLQAKLQAILKP